MRKFLMLLFTMLLLTTFANAQTHIINGTVTDDAGNPVSGASVTIKGSANGAAADSSGSFSISAKPGQILQVSAAGFITTEVKITASHDLVIVLKHGNNVMEEVVVTALGQSSHREKLGYSTSTFNSTELTRTANVSAFDGLAGKVAGAEISSTGGPGSSTKVILRGYGVIAGGGNQPLYVIDGVPLSNARPGSTIGLTTVNDFGNGADEINPNDIASITILKGTAASSLYGSAARNGAIMITTKRGKAGKIRIDFAGSVNFSKVGKLPDLQDKYGQGWSSTFILSENGSWGPRLDGKMRPWGSIVDNSQLVKPFSAIKDNIRNFYTTGIELNNNIAVSGGSDITTFYFSYGNVVSDGVIPTSIDYLGRNNLSLRTNSRFKKLSINTSFNYVNRKVKQPATGQGSASGSTIFQDILQIPVDIPIHDFRDYTNKFFDVNSYFSPYSENPYYGLHNNGNSQVSDRFFGNLDMNYQIVSSLSAQLRVGGDVQNARGLTYNAVNDPVPGSWAKGGNPENANRAKDVGSVAESSDYIGSINADFILKYKHDLSNDFSLDALAGVNYNQADTKSNFASITDLLIPGFYNLSNSSNPPTATDASTHQRLIGAYAQATIGYKDELYLTGNARNDWSSTLPIDHNHFFYPGGSLSWVASNTFDLSNSHISYLQFRAGYGKTGTSAPVYNIYSVLTPGTVPLPVNKAFVTFPFDGVSSFRISNTITNPALKPVITSEAELGMAIGFFNGALGIDATVYDKKTDGQIFNVPISPGSGYSSIVRNIGLVENRGIELSLTAKPVSSPSFSWNFTGNFTTNNNKVVHLTSGLSKVTIFGIVGGIELNAEPGKTASGLYAFGPQLTPDGKVIVSEKTGRPLPSSNRIYYGNAENDYTVGFSNSLRYKQVQLNFSLDFRKGGVFYSKTAEQLLFTGNGVPTIYNDRRPFIVPNSVIQIGTDGQGKPVYAENKTPITEDAIPEFFPENTNAAFAYKNDILDRSFLKLRDISLSYALSDKLASRIKVSHLAVTIYARNLLLWTPSSNMYIDPEASNFGNDLTSQIGEFETAPISKQFGVALKANF